MNEQLEKKDYFSIIFTIGMWWRIIYGIFKLFLGISLLWFVHSSFTELFYKIAGHELLEDPNDILINSLGFFINNTTASVTYFISFYFIFWGLLDSFLSINLLKLRLWSYPIKGPSANKQGRCFCSRRCCRSPL